MSFRLVPKSVTLNDLERRNGRYIASLLYFVVRVRCRRKESSRSLSHLLMIFLFFLVRLRHTKRYRPNDKITTAFSAEATVGRRCQVVWRGH